MRTRLLPLALLLAILSAAPSAVAAGASAAPAAPAAATPATDLAVHPRVAERLALFELWIEDWMAALDQPGLAIGIVVRDPGGEGSELAWARGFGLADVARGEPVTPRTVFRLGSISKTFTATALMQLRDAGRLRLDDPVAAHLPWFTYRDRFPAGPRITLWHLLTHTSGLPRDAAFPYWTDRRFPSREELARGLAGQEIVYEPGTRYKYSNLGIALAGAVIEAVEARPYAEVVRRRILEPLAMGSTWVELPPAGAGLATGYLARRRDGTLPVAPPTAAAALAPSANLSSTVEDLGRYLAAHLGAPLRGGPGGEPLLAAPSRREMQRVHWLADDWSSGRGLGFSVWRQGERTLVGHGGWVAGHRAQIAFDPAAGMGVAVLTNGDAGGPADYVRQAFELVAPALAAAAAASPGSSAAPAASAPPPVLDPTLGRYLGAYHTPFGEESRVVAIDGGLAIYDHTHPPPRDPLGSLTRLTADGEDAFRMTGDNGNGERVVFELGAGGRVERVKQGENYLYPEGCGEVVELRCTWE